MNFFLNLAVLATASGRAAGAADVAAAGPLGLVTAVETDWCGVVGSLLLLNFPLEGGHLVGFDLFDSDHWLAGF